MTPAYSVRLDWSDIDRAYIATSPEFRGLTGVDEDPAKALDELREAIDMAIEVLLEDGEQVPEPRKLIEHSGQFRLRIPKYLHQVLAQQASEQGVSLNTHVLALLAISAGETRAQSSLRGEVEDLLRELRTEVAETVLPLAARSATANVSSDEVSKLFGLMGAPATQLHS